MAVKFFEKKKHRMISGVLKLRQIYYTTIILGGRKKNITSSFVFLTVMPGIKNFLLVKKGAAIGFNPDTKEKIFAKKSFYPILFGKNSYKTTFGFSAKKRML